MERPIDFRCDRHMLCAGCSHRFIVDLDWIDRWGRGIEKCPGCGSACEHEDAPRVTVDPDDPALDNERASQFSWYHTSTHADWPAKNFDPGASLTHETRALMGGDDRVAAWAAHQRAKALHVGTYEAAVHNMLRRIRSQGDYDSQFYLYRVHLKPSVSIRDGWRTDPSNWLGDVFLDDVCPPGVDVARYLNYHEDPGRISLALGRDAIASVQQIAIPPPTTWNSEWVRGAVVALEEASDVPVAATGKLARIRRASSASPRIVKARELGTDLARKLPISLRDQFTSAAAFEEGGDPERWARRVSSLFGLFEDPKHVLTILDNAPQRRV